MEPSRVPPGPRSALFSMIQIARDPMAFYERSVARYGDPFSTPSFEGTVVGSGDPEWLRAVFSADPDTFEFFTPATIELAFGKNAILILTGARHRKERQILMPPFHGARMKTYGALMQRIAARHIDSWKAGQPFIVDDTTQAISLEIILQAVFGVVEPEAVAQFRDAILEYAASLHPLLMFAPNLARRLGALGPMPRFRRAGARLDALLFAYIAARRQDVAVRDDILRLMIDARREDGEGMSDEEIRDELIALSFAGHETTAIALAWACYWIHRDEAVRARLLDEIRSVGAQPAPETVAALPYLDAVCKETLRLHPVLPEVMRRLTRPFTFRDYVIPAGHGIACCISLTHRREELYPEPLRFRPERFIERQFSPFEFIPFGGGPHRCLGAAFALYEMKLVLATMLARHELRLADGKERRPRRRNVTFGPGGGVALVVANPSS